MTKTHGESGTKLYKLWRSIIIRCHGGGAHKHESYGARGITMYGPWLSSYELFRDYISQLPGYGEPGLSLDRINNDGNYEPGNLRFVNQHTQRLNSRPQKRNKTGSKNIRKTSSGYRVSINLGTFSTLERAITIRDNALNKLDIIRKG